MFKAAVLTVSDRSFRGERPDAGGPLVAELLEAGAFTLTEDSLRQSFHRVSRVWSLGGN